MNPSTSPVRDAGRDDPVVARAERALAELDLHAEFELERPAGGRDLVRPVVPAAQARVGPAVERRHIGVERDPTLGLVRGAEDRRHQPVAAGELGLVAEHLDPVVGAEPQHLVLAEAVDLDLVDLGEVDDRAEDRPVLRRPLERRQAERAGLVDLDSVQPVFEPAVPGFGQDRARVVGVGGGDGRGREPPGGRGDQRIPRRQFAAAADLAGVDRTVVSLLVAQDPDRPHRLHPGRRIGTAEGDLAEVRVFDRGDVAAPHVEVQQVGPPGPFGGVERLAERWRRVGGEVRLCEIGRQHSDRDVLVAGERRDVLGQLEAGCLDIDRADPGDDLVARRAGDGDPLADLERAPR